MHISLTPWFYYYHYYLSGCEDVESEDSNVSHYYSVPLLNIVYGLLILDLEANREFQWRRRTQENAWTTASQGKAGHRRASIHAGMTRTFEIYLMVPSNLTTYNSRTRVHQKCHCLRALNCLQYFSFHLRYELAFVVLATGGNILWFSI